MPNTMRMLVTGGICTLLSLMCGYWVASQQYFALGLGLAAALVWLLIVVPGYSFLLAFGVLCPFILPLPFVYAFPVIGLVLGLMVLKFAFRRSMGIQQQRLRINMLPVAFYLMFGWILFRYCLNPVGPGLALGLSVNISGFRFYVNYGMCFFVCVALCSVFTDFTQTLSLVRWLRRCSLLFVLVLTPFVFSNSLTAVQLLTQLGVYVTPFDNGLLRIVVLPMFGVILIAIGLLPDLSGHRKVVRIFDVVLGALAVILSGNRSGFAMAVAICLCIPLLKRRYYLVGAQVAVLAFLIAGSFVLTEHFNLRSVGFLRPLALVNPQLAENSDANATTEWRMIRWKRALEEIRDHPVVGRGYGGVENVMTFHRTYQDYEQAQLEMDIATGGVHNGYLASALALGIPAALTFIYILIAQLRLNWRRARMLAKSDRAQSELHCFVFANLVAFAITIYIGTDINAPILWLLLALGPMVVRLQQPVSHSVGRSDIVETTNLTIRSKIGGAPARDTATH